jgi:hypothetical protein
MSVETPDTAVAIPPVAPQTAEPKTVKVTAPKSDKTKKAKAPKAKSSKPKAAAGKGKKAKTPATSSKAKKPAKQVKAKSAKTPKAKPAKVVKAGKYPRHPKNPFREGSAYGQIFDAFVLKDTGIRRDELLQLAMDATGKDVVHAAYDLAVIRSAKESNNGPRHPSCRNGFYTTREGDCFTLVID